MTRNRKVLYEDSIPDESFAGKSILHNSVLSFTCEEFKSVSEIKPSPKHSSKFEEIKEEYPMKNMGI